MVPQVNEHHRYWGSTFIVCIVPKCEEEIAVIPDFQDVEVRGRRYSMLSVLLGLPLRCHRCKVRGHLAYPCVACHYCGNGSHTSEEHSIENAMRRQFSAVVGATQGTQEFWDWGGGDGGERASRGTAGESVPAGASHAADPWYVRGGGGRGWERGG